MYHFLTLPTRNLPLISRRIPESVIDSRWTHGPKFISWTVSTLERGGVQTSSPLQTSYLRFWLARNARAYTSARSIGFCVIWVCISSSSSFPEFLAPGIRGFLVWDHSVSVRTYVRHVLAYDNVSEQARKVFLCLWCNGLTDGHFSGIAASFGETGILRTVTVLFCSILSVVKAKASALLA